MGISKLRHAREDEEAIAHLCDFVQERTGIQLGAQKHGMVRMRLEGRLRALHLDGFAAYYDFLATERDSYELVTTIDLLTTNKTSFFREPRHFEVLEKHLRSCAGRGKEMRLWSAGCSTGEEPYTMALVAHASGANVRVLGTDLSTRVVATARTGRYRKDALSEVPGAYRAAYFEAADEDVQVTEALRSRVDLARLNLLESWPMRGPFQAIFCRNVMIYFDRGTRERLVARFREKLAPDGLLFVGLSESLSGIQDTFRLVEPGVYAR